jgi:hypothetical protein
MTDMPDKDTIRKLIRDVIAEEIGRLNGGTPAAAPTAVAIASDADLAAFARQVLRLAEDPKVRSEIEAGRYPFRLAGPAAAAPTGKATTGGTHRIDVGVVTEAGIAKLPPNVKRLQLGPGVSITPLARDKARARNISVERIRP